MQKIVFAINSKIKLIESQNERIEELEEALRESVRITADKEYELNDKEMSLRRAEEQVCSDH